MGTADSGRRSGTSLIQTEGFESLKHNWQHYRESPADYVQDIILAKRADRIKLFPYQADILDTVAKHNWVVLCGCNGMGKDALTAWLIEWFLMTHPYSKIPCTSGVTRQIKEILFSEVHKYSKQSKMSHAMKFMDMAVRVKGAEKEWFALGFTSKEGEEGEMESKAEGFHADNLMYVVTEAKAVPDYMWTAIYKACTQKDNRIFAQSVPGIEYGEFHKIWCSHRDTWTRIYFAGAKKEQAADGTYKWISQTPLISQQSIDEKLAENGEDSAIFQSSVLGNFIKQSEDNLIALDWVRQACERTIEISQKDEVAYGVDVARFGCFDDKTEILTDKGWKLFDALLGIEKILSMNPFTKKIEWMPIKKVHKYRFKGKMNLYDWEKINFCVTDNHKFLIRSHPKSKNYVFKQFKDLPKEWVAIGHGKWNGRNPTKIRFVNKIKQPHGGINKKEWIFNYYDWCEFLGWWLSEGSMFKETKGRWRIQIAQKNPSKILRIKNLLERMRFGYRINRFQFEFSNNKIGEHLLKYCGNGSHRKRIPLYLKESSVKAIRVFLNAYLAGDGTSKLDGTGKTYMTSSKQMANDLHELLSKLGVAGKISLIAKIGSKFFIDGREAIRRADVYAIGENSKKNDKWIEKFRLKKIYYDGFVYCVSTPYKTILTRREGSVIWSGNSDESVVVKRKGNAVIDMKCFTGIDTMRLAQIVQDMWEQENGKINVDIIGVGGGVADKLRMEGIPKVSGVNVAEKSNFEYKYDRLRSELWGNMRDLLDLKNPEPITIPNDSKLISQLTTIKYSISNSGLVKIESKESMSKRGLSSPDRADALCLAFFGKRPPRVKRISNQIADPNIFRLTSKKTQGAFSRVMGIPI